MIDPSISNNMTYEILLTFCIFHITHSENNKERLLRKIQVENNNDFIKNTVILNIIVIVVSCLLVRDYEY